MRRRRLLSLVPRLLALPKQSCWDYLRINGRGRSAARLRAKPHDKPNIVFGADVHVCLDKFARYFDVEPRIIPMDLDRFTISAETVSERIDENTICVGAILGTTFTGGADPVKEISDLLMEIKETKGGDIPIQVDAASGGFITPFANPELEMDFRLPQVKSINVSGHKYGLVYPGLGWLIFRDHIYPPEDLIFYVNYLGDEMPTYTLNFSRGSAMVLAQYYNPVAIWPRRVHLIRDEPSEERPLSR